MKRGERHRAARLLAGLGTGAVLAACGSGGLGAADSSRSTTPTMLSQRPGPPAALIVVVDPRRLDGAVDRSARLLAGTARTTEHVTVLVGNDVVVSSTSPSEELTDSVPGGPVLPAHATPYQRKKYDKAKTLHDDAVTSHQGALQQRQQQAVDGWAASLRPALAQLGDLPALALFVEPAFVQAQASLASLAAAGVDLGDRKVIVVEGGDAAWLAAPTATTGSLQGATVVVEQFAGGPDDIARVQSRLVQAGAGRAVILTASASADVQRVVAQALSGRVVESVPEVSFALGSADLSPSAEPDLRRLAALLTSSYPTATAVVNGYTDSLGTGAGNVALAQQRADAVKAWLVAHNVAANRLQALGHGALDPTVPNSRGGQPANRRVVTVINPVA